MQALLIRVTTDKRTGQLLEERIIGIQEVDEDTYYRPLVEIIGRRLAEALENIRQKGG